MPEDMRPLYAVLADKREWRLTTMIEPAAGLLHFVPTEDWETHGPEGSFSGITFQGSALCGKDPKELDILHPVGDRMRYASIIGSVELCEDCNQGRPADE